MYVDSTAAPTQPGVSNIIDDAIQWGKDAVGIDSGESTTTGTPPTVETGTPPVAVVEEGPSTGTVLVYVGVGAAALYIIGSIADWW